MELARRGACPPGSAPEGDRVELDIARALCGDRKELTARVLAPDRYRLPWALAAIETTPTRQHLDLLVSVIEQAGSLETLLRIAARLHASPPGDDVNAARAWWKKRRATWKE